MGNIGGGLVFLVFALVTVFSAYLVISSRNIIHSALFLILTFIGVAALYAMLDADFLAMVQLLVYAGAISIMVVFGVMLTLRGGPENSNGDTRNAIGGAIAALLTFVVLGMVIFTNSAWLTTGTGISGGSTVSDVSWLLLTKYVVPFEVAAVLLLVAMVGAIILAKGVDDSK
ncbi:MAG: NADH-quinone oxidoreductase subunit J [Peptococcaceae bacterium]|nr:NADH-quinone oxidoreductase subunit J [Peptococcaceae bacterium]